ncbi:phospholipid phosphatase [Leuconostoc litchii]|uniref:Phospholipid phosphatase n=2 Tax=Leuconostoc litchii TaxID=1981069 RepID=A0A6P2CQI1_9LACO|nr:phospholipid phosphatase [Leuconostoc litchii]
MLIPPDKVRKRLIIIFGIAFIFLAIQVRFHTIFIQVIDAASDFVVHGILATKVPLFFSLGHFFANYWVVILMILVVVSFLSFINYQVAAWWFGIMQVLGMLVTWLITFILRIHWQDGPQLGETIPSLLLMWWMQILLIVIIIVSHLVKSRNIQIVFCILLVSFWSIIMLDRIFSYNMAFTSGLGAMTFGYSWWQFSAKQYYEHAKHWQKVLKIDGRV